MASTPSRRGRARPPHAAAAAPTAQPLPLLQHRPRSLPALPGSVPAPGEADDPLRPIPPRAAVPVRVSTTARRRPCCVPRPRTVARPRRGEALSEGPPRRTWLRQSGRRVDPLPTPPRYLPPLGPLDRREPRLHPRRCRHLGRLFCRAGGGKRPRSRGAGAIEAFPADRLPGAGRGRDSRPLQRLRALEARSGPCFPRRDEEDGRGRTLIPSLPLPRHRHRA